MELQGTAKDQLRTIVARVERLEEEKSALSQDIKEVFAEAKSNGFDVAALRKIVKLRRQDEQKRREADAILATYCHALGMTAQGDLFEEPKSEAA